jgi:ATP-binding cassette subfamily C protein CydD
VRFEGIYLAYDGGRRPALRGVEVEIPAGHTTALVGPTGAGKSSAAALLLRFVAPDRGRILVDGTPLAQIEPDAWRDRLAWVPQHPHLFHGTVAENIRLARPEATMDDVERAARDANAHEFIRRLPQGYHTPLGEQGARLSGGQRQRIAIARAFLKDAPLVILDEATAHLDTETENAIRAALTRLLRGRTTMLIAHRLRLAYEADQIVLLEQGQVVAAGIHEELLQTAPGYRALVAAYEGAPE